LANDMNSNTVGALLAYCDWLLGKHYATVSQIKPWKIAIHKVFGAVADDGRYESISLERVDLDDVALRFRTYGAQQYKSESIDAYLSRIRRAIDAYTYWRENGRPPVFRKVGQKSAGTSQESGAPRKPTSTRPPARQSMPEVPSHVSATERYEFSYPLSRGMAHISVPMPMSHRDIDRIKTVLGTLEEQPQIPESTGEPKAA